MPTVGEKAFHDLCDTLENLPWPNPLIGKAEDAERQLIEATDRWILLRQPIVAGAKKHREIELQEREARFRLAEAAAFWAYFKRDPYLVVHPASDDTHPEGGDVKQAPLVSGAVGDSRDAQTPSPAAKEPSLGNNRDGQIR